MPKNGSLFTISNITLAYKVKLIKKHNKIVRSLDGLNTNCVKISVNSSFLGTDPMYM